jgi:hypothetical protein
MQPAAVRSGLMPFSLRPFEIQKMPADNRPPIADEPNCIVLD